MMIDASSVSLRRRGQLAANICRPRRIHSPEEHEEEGDGKDLGHRTQTSQAGEGSWGSCWRGCRLRWGYL